MTTKLAFAFAAFLFSSCLSSPDSGSGDNTDPSRTNPNIRILKAEYDSVAEVVSVSWNRLPGVETYVVQRTVLDSGGASAYSETEYVVWDTTFENMVYLGGNRWPILSYRVGEWVSPEAKPSYSERVELRPGYTFRQTASWPDTIGYRMDIEGAVNQFAWKGNPVTFSITATSQRTVDSLIWWLPGSSSPTRIAAPGADSARDSVTLRWPETGVARVAVEIVDFSGRRVLVDRVISVIDEFEKCLCLAPVSTFPPFLLNASSAEVRGHVMDPRQVRIRSLVTEGVELRLLMSLQGWSKGKMFFQEGQRVDIDSSLEGRLISSGWTAMPWIRPKTEGDQLLLDVETYTNAFNALPESQRTWRAFSTDNRFQPNVVNAPSGNEIKGTFRFRSDLTPASNSYTGRFVDSQQWQRLLLRDPDATNSRHQALQDGQELVLNLQRGPEGDAFPMKVFWAQFRRVDAQTGDTAYADLGPEDAMVWEVRAPYLKLKTPEIRVHLAGIADDIPSIVTRTETIWEINSQTPSEHLHPKAFRYRLGDEEKAIAFLARVQNTAQFNSDSMYTLGLEFLRETMPTHGVDTLAVNELIVRGARYSKSFALPLEVERWQEGVHVVWITASSEFAVTGPFHNGYPAPARVDNPFSHDANPMIFRIRHSKPEVLSP